MMMASFEFTASSYGCRRVDLASRVLEIDAPAFDFDSFAEVATPLLHGLGMTVLSQELNADLHVWLVDFEGCQLLLKGEHYSGLLWLEGLADSEDTLAYLAQQLAQVIIR
ncbi:aminopeptidase N [Photobacterium aphoticum]|uniref:Aminopeptidase N n=1 Tax=Photobacterium aphoticum TaxID=754436 RepID=A0A090QX40_9GAMM|nr:aminopeptidase N [Photobacterium aphoticum]